MQGNALVIIHQRAPYGVYFAKNCTTPLRCTFKFRYYLEFHGAGTAFCRLIEGKQT